ncbi:hypothetical protein RFF05_07045 [Bengtsoniella intestinalis]|uniref:hypothetical protein n=1 Tax=Bengtsoniella intestinalis TaxID=3073143 RepID=UPI00391F2009
MLDVKKYQVFSFTKAVIILKKISTKQQFLNLLAHADKIIPLSEAQSMLVSDDITPTAFNQALYELLISGRISCSPAGVTLYTQTLHQWINNLEDLFKKTILTEFFNGENTTSLSMQEIRIHLKEALKSRPPLVEDSFRKIFGQYKFDLDSFTTILAQPSYVYRYLNETCKKGKPDWRDIRHDMSFSEESRMTTTDLITSKGLLIDSSEIAFSSESVLYFLLKSRRQKFQKKTFMPNMWRS